MNDRAKIKLVTLVLLPGMDGTGDLFADFIAALDSDVTPVIISYPTTRELDYEALTEYARAGLPVEGNFIILGESFSGPIAISLAAENPVGLVGLILCCSFARNPLPALRSLRNVTRFLPVSGRFSALISPLLCGRFTSPSLRASLRRALDRVSASVLRARLKAVLDVDYLSKLSVVRVPMLYLQASDDRVVPSSALQHILRLRPGTSAIRVEAPHLLLQASPKAAAEVVKTFLQSCSQ